MLGSPRIFARATVAAQFASQHSVPLTLIRCKRPLKRPGGPLGKMTSDLLGRRGKPALVGTPVESADAPEPGKSNVSPPVASIRPPSFAGTEPPRRNNRT